MRRFGIGLIAAAALLAGCGGSGDDGTTLTAGPAEPISYEVYTGYPPIVRSIEIDADGNAVTSVQYRDDARARRAELAVPKRRLRSIRAHLAASDFGELPDDQCTDCVFVTLTYGDEEAKGGTTVPPEQHEDTPENLRIAIDMLTELLPPLEQPQAEGGA